MATMEHKAPGGAKRPQRAGTKTWVRAGAAVVAIVALVLLAKWLRTLEPLHDFLSTYPGHVELPNNAPTGLPAWLGWQHFLNAFFIVLIIRSGIAVRTTARPKAFWTPKKRGKNPPKKISLDLWFHQSLDILWLANGVVFIVLLFATNQWMRIVPTSWEIIPNAVSAGLQYASLDWPTEDGWVNYNSLQVLAYFLTVFIAAPLAVVSGARMSELWPKNAQGLNRIYPVEAARAIHFPVMIYFVGFVIVHVFLVFATGALRNLNHMYAAQSSDGWLGFWIFIGSIVTTAAAWLLARPLFLTPMASLFGKVSSR